VQVTQLPVASQTPVWPVQGIPGDVICTPHTFFSQVAAAQGPLPGHCVADMQPPPVLELELELELVVWPPVLELELVVGLPVLEVLLVVCPPMLDVLEVVDMVLVVDVGPTVAWPLEPPAPRPAESRKQPLGAVSPTQDRATSAPAPSTTRCRSIHEAIVPPSAEAKPGPARTRSSVSPIPRSGES
jgi:hypothetical protein